MTTRAKMRSTRSEERDQVFLLLVGEPKQEALVIKLDRIIEGLGGSVMEIRSAPDRPRSTGPLVFPRLHICR